ncbi:MAG: putative tRNA-dihydrouridine synthase [Chlamydiales bacterium]|nr:putative tRNA-dihydrouridine synthase [Chlamydiales bacterium]MCH9635123.1 putative tRNA-dihydrouridine synthase [Chlamydiales bacterium]MCH9703586.1 tRNA dihydrouridine synthase DusB [Chlamydiota bacterium]
MKFFEKPVVYAPLAGCSDYPFRKISARYNPGLMYCEMVKMQPLLMGNENTMRMLDYSQDMRPIGGQICGSDPKLAGPSAKIIEDLGFDCVDLNCGCPVDKVTKDGSGSGMLKDLDRIGDVLSNMVAAVKIPVTVKIRAGWDEENIVASEVTRIAEEAGAAVICVHGRTRKQAYRGPANWDHIKAAKQAANKIKVVGNGDVFDADSASRMLQETGCDAVLVARGTMGQPWIVEDIMRALEGKEPIERSSALRKRTLLDHFHLSANYKNERGALIDMRRVCSWYLKSAPGVREIRSKAAKGANLEEIRTIIESFDFVG